MYENDRVKPGQVVVIDEGIAWIALRRGAIYASQYPMNLSISAIIYRQDLSQTIYQISIHPWRDFLRNTFPENHEALIKRIVELVNEQKDYLV